MRKHRWEFFKTFLEETYEKNVNTGMRTEMRKEKRILWKCRLCAALSAAKEGGRPGKLLKVSGLGCDELEVLRILSE